MNCKKRKGNHKFGFGGMMEMRYIAKDIPLWQVTIWDKKFNNVDKKWQPKTIKYKYLLSDELDSLRVDDGDVRILYTGKDVGFTTEELAGDRLSEGEIISIPWGGIPTVKYHKGKFVTGDNRIATSKDIDKLTNKYLYYFMRGNIHEIASYYRGASLKHPCMKDILKMTISYPSVQEQDKICGQFDVLEQIIEVRKQELQLLDDLIKARFVEMFGNSVLNEKGWITDTVDNLCKEIYGGGTPSKVHPEYYKDGDIPWVSSKDMKTDILTDSQIKINQMGVENSTARMVPVNSVIMVIRSGILKHTLPVAINAVPITVNQDLKVFIPSERILTRFLAVQFKMHEKDILTGVRAVTADNIEFNSLKQRKLIVPSIELQQEYVLFLEQVDKSKVIEIIK